MLKAQESNVGLFHATRWRLFPASSGGLMILFRKK